MDKATIPHESQQDKAAKLIATGRVHLMVTPSRDGWAVTPGAATVEGREGLYVITAEACTCPAGKAGRACYHRLAVRALCAAIRERKEKHLPESREVKLALACFRDWHSPKAKAERAAKVANDLEELGFG